MTIRGMPNTVVVVERRRKDAEKRAVEYAKLSLKDRLARLDEQCSTFGGSAKKQRARLEAERDSKQSGNEKLTEGERVAQSVQRAKSSEPVYLGSFVQFAGN
jgi:hypothetical protein